LLLFLGLASNLQRVQAMGNPASVDIPFHLAELASSSFAQGGWSFPQRVPEYDDESDTPILIADQNQTVHAFSSHPMDGESVIVYRQWTVDGGWSPLVDIILPPFGSNAHMGGVILDGFGTFHLTFFSGNDFAANIYYTQAPAINAGRAPAWSKPILIGEDAATPAEVTIAGDGGGHLFILYSGKYEGIGLYFVESVDDGYSWTSQVPIDLVYSNELWPAHMNAYMDMQGNVHAFWSVVGTTGNGEGIYYSRLEFPYTNWTESIELVVRDGYEADWPAMTEHEGSLILVYQNGTPATRWMRISNDSGRTWSEPAHFSFTVGEYGFTDFVHDSSGRLHMFLGNRTGAAIHGMWHLTWQSNRWSDPVPVVSGPRVVAPIGATGFDPTGPAAVISQGNVLLLTWKTDSGAGRNGIWFSYNLLDTPSLPIVPLAEPQAQSVVTPPVAATATAEPTSNPIPLVVRETGNGSLAFDRDLAQMRQQSPQVIVLLSIMPVFFLISIVVSVWRYRSYRNR
jgi:hypothetical protein